MPVAPPMPPQAAIALPDPASLTRGAATRPSHLVLLLLAFVLLAACDVPVGSMTPPSPLLAGHNGLLYIELPPDGTPETDPTVTVTADIIDSVTEAPW